MCFGLSQLTLARLVARVTAERNSWQAPNNIWWDSVCGLSNPAVPSKIRREHRTGQVHCNPPIGPHCAQLKKHSCSQQANCDVAYTHRLHSTLPGRLSAVASRIDTAVISSVDSLRLRVVLITPACYLRFATRRHIQDEQQQPSSAAGHRNEQSRLSRSRAQGL